jgi:hypothetical protein
MSQRRQHHTGQHGCSCGSRTAAQAPHLRAGSSAGSTSAGLMDVAVQHSKTALSAGAGAAAAATACLLRRRALSSTDTECDRLCFQWKVRQHQAAEHLMAQLYITRVFRHKVCTPHTHANVFVLLRGLLYSGTQYDMDKGGLG